MVLTKAMGILPASLRVRSSLFAAVLVGLFAVPAAASADCTLPTVSDDELSGGTTQTFEGNFGPELKGKFIQIPFDVGTGVKGMRISYCYDASSDATAVGGIKNTTLDLGVYEPNGADPENFTINQLRGWSGSAIKTIGIGENGPTDTATYNTSRKAYVPGNTTRAYRPGTMPEGKWAVELGAGYIDPALTAGTTWKVEVRTSTDPAWADENFTPDPYTPYVANASPGWYSGDLHVHGENEPGNAPMTDSFNLGFNQVGLDFMTLVDHNNDTARKTELGTYEPLYPGKLIIPGTEMTTYDGHFNSQNSDVFTDFRLSQIFLWDDDGNFTLDDGELTSVRNAEDPASRFAQIDDAGGWVQINHPTTFKDAPAVCRGCAWTYSDDRTDFSKVDAIEIATGPTGIASGNPSAMNPFVESAIQYYEHALATGAHVAAVTSSDDHQARAVPGVTDSTLGQGTTMVQADQLSQSGITAGVKAGHTYAKPFGPATPDVAMKAGEPGKAGYNAIPGDSVTGPSMNIQLNVKNGGPLANPAGPYTLEVLQDGISIDSATVVGDDFNHNLNVDETGRYSFKLTRQVTVGNESNTLIMAYSTPVWFTQKSVPTCATNPSLCPKPSNRFTFKRVTLNKKKGTGRIKVKFPSLGKATLTGPGLTKVKATVKKKGQVIGLNLKPKASLKKRLKRKGSIKVKVKVYFRPTGGKALTKSKPVKLVLKKKAKKHRK
jgi:hypothetical protein